MHMFHIFLKKLYISSGCMFIKTHEIIVVHVFFGFTVKATNFSRAIMASIWPHSKDELTDYVHVWAKHSRFGYISQREQRMPRRSRACAYAQSRQSINSLNVPSMEAEKGSHQILDLKPNRYVSPFVKFVGSICYGGRRVTGNIIIINQTPPLGA